MGLGITPTLVIRTKVVMDRRCGCLKQITPLPMFLMVAFGLELKTAGILLNTRVRNRNGRRAGFCPGFATRPGNPGSGLGSGSQILNFGFRAGLDFGSGFRVPERKPRIFRFFFILE